MKNTGLYSLELYRASFLSRWRVYRSVVNRSDLDLAESDYASLPLIDLSNSPDALTNTLELLVDKLAAVNEAGDPVTLKLALLAQGSLSGVIDVMWSTELNLTTGQRQATRVSNLPAGKYVVVVKQLPDPGVPAVYVSVINDTTDAVDGAYTKTEDADGSGTPGWRNDNLGSYIIWSGDTWHLVLPETRLYVSSNPDPAYPSGVFESSDTFDRTRSANASLTRVVHPKGYIDASNSSDGEDNVGGHYVLENPTANGTVRVWRRDDGASLGYTNGFWRFSNDPAIYLKGAAAIDTLNPVFTRDAVTARASAELSFSRPSPSEIVITDGSTDMTGADFTGTYTQDPGNAEAYLSYSFIDDTTILIIVPTRDDTGTDMVGEWLLQKDSEGNYLTGTSRVWKRADNATISWDWDNGIWVFSNAHFQLSGEEAIDDPNNQFYASWTYATAGANRTWSNPDSGISISYDGNHWVFSNGSGFQLSGQNSIDNPALRFVAVWVTDVVSALTVPCNRAYTLSVGSAVGPAQADIGGTYTPADVNVSGFERAWYRSPDAASLTYNPETSIWSFSADPAFTIDTWDIDSATSVLLDYTEVTNYAVTVDPEFSTPQFNIHLRQSVLKMP